MDDSGTKQGDFKPNKYAHLTISWVVFPRFKGYNIDRAMAYYVHLLLVPIDTISSNVM